MTFNNSEKAGVRITQSTLTFVISLITLFGLAYSYAADRIDVRRDVEELQKSYVEMTNGQKNMAREMKDLRGVLNGEVRKLTKELNQLNINLAEIRAQTNR